MNDKKFEKDSYWMERALALAKHAEQQNEVPVGAVIVLNGEMIGEGWNQSIATADPTAHAEIIALRQAAKHLGNYRLIDATMYVTLEPCAMCAGAMVHARIKHLVYAAADPKAGAVQSVFQLLNSEQLNHRVKYTDGLLAKESSALLKNFFKKRRANLRDSQKIN